MKTEELKAKIEAANRAYRSGTAIMTDAAYDALLEEYKAAVPSAEFDVFLNSLHEVAGKVKHPYVLGSLNKLKADDKEAVITFINEHITTGLHISAKVDGISCRLHYENGKLTSASTRGNGEFGEDLTDKIQYVKFVPKEIQTQVPIDIRGELVILRSDFEEHFAEDFANPRNAVAGLMNRKDWNKEDISNVSFIAYTVLGPKLSKTEQFEILNANGFTVADVMTISGNRLHEKDFLEVIVDRLTQLAEQTFDYEHDGLVISDLTYHNEDKYRPDAQVAFKINQQTATTTLLDVVFEGPSKNGTHVPVAILDPVQIGGVMVGRCTLHNLDFIDKFGLRCGDTVRILRSGDVIPKLVEVIPGNENETTEIKLPLVCNCCGEKLVRDGVNYRCVNPDCKEQVLHRLTSFIIKLGVKGSTEKTLENLGILTLDDLLAFKPNSGSKIQMKLYDELQTKVFSRSKQELLAAMNIRDVGKTLINRIVDFYGMDNVIAGNYVGLPNGIGETTLEKFKSEVVENLTNVEKIMKDSRYSGSNQMTEAVQKKATNGMSVCFTGKLNTMGRTEAEKKAMAAGFEVKDVNRKLTYLVTNDPNTNSGKGKKARELDIKIISEAEFLKMISDSNEDIGDL